MRHDFSLVYVARLTSEQLPLGYTLSAFWGGQEGSLLLWLLVLTGYSALVVATSRRRKSELLPWVVPPLALVALFFAFMLVAISSPFETQLAPPNGAGLNPSLQNPYMVAHPPLLYLGYVGLTIPWAFGMGALLARRADEAWIIATRRWTLVAWTALGVGQLLGAKWAYEEIGWGGYFAWDPVENAALMPWLAATAFLHSVMIQEKRGMLKVWNLLLVILAFGLSLFGTFLTRSGILDSIHSFTESSIGPWFLGFIVLVLDVLDRARVHAPAAAPLAHAARVARLARGDVPLQQPAARRALPDDPLGRDLAAALRGGARRGERRGRPVLQLLPARLRAAAAAPDGRWRRSSRGGARRSARSARRSPGRPGSRRESRSSCSRSARARRPSGCSRTRSPPSCSARSATSSCAARGRGARSKAEAGDGAFSSLVGRNRRRYGGYVVHAAIVLLAIGVAGSAYDTVREGRLARGERLEVAGYTLTYLGTTERMSANARELRARVDVQRDGRDLGIIEPGKNFYPVEQQVSAEPAIRADAMSLGDLFVILENANADGSVRLKALVNPLVNLIWLAGLVFLAGSLIALWPDPAEERRLLERYALAPA